MRVLIVLQPEQGRAEVASGKLFRLLHSHPLTRWVLRRSKLQIGQGSWVEVQTVQEAQTQVALLWTAAEKNWASQPPHPLRVVE